MTSRPVQFGLYPIALGAALALTGCRDRAETASAPVAAATAPADAAEGAAQPVAVSLTTADGAALAKLLASKRGQVVLVDCWATWCVPCRQGFPHTVALYRDLAAQGLAVISVSFDDAQDEQSLADVRGFLTEQEAAFDNLVSQFGAGEESFTAFGVDNGALPHYQLYDRQGQLVRKFQSGDPNGKPFTHEDIRQAVEEQLRAGG